MPQKMDDSKSKTNFKFANLSFGRDIFTAFQILVNFFSLPPKKTQCYCSKFTRLHISLLVLRVKYNATKHSSVFFVFQLFLFVVTFCLIFCWVGQKCSCLLANNCSRPNIRQKTYNTSCKERRKMPQKMDEPFQIPILNLPIFHLDFVCNTAFYNSAEETIKYQQCQLIFFERQLQNVTHDCIKHTFRFQLWPTCIKPFFGSHPSFLLQKTRIGTKKSVWCVLNKTNNIFSFCDGQKLLGVRGSVSWFDHVCSLALGKDTGLQRSLRSAGRNSVVESARTDLYAIICCHQQDRVFLWKISGANIRTQLTSSFCSRTQNK